MSRAETPHASVPPYKLKFELRGGGGVAKTSDDSTITRTGRILTNIFKLGPTVHKQ